MKNILELSKLLINKNPTLAEEWHKSLNYCLDLTQIYANSGKKAYWQCRSCSHEWEAIIASRNRGNGCPNCAGKVANKTNSLQVIAPEVAAEYSITLNDLSLETITAYSSRKVWWECSREKDHKWETTPINRVKTNTGCPYCSGRLASSTNNLETIFPEIAKEFDEEKNFPITARDVTPLSPKIFWWLCDKNHSWQAAAGGRQNKGHIIECPYCSHKRVCADNNLAITDPVLAQEYSLTLNTIPVTEILRKSKKKCWWQCSKNIEHQWEATPLTRTRTKATGCPDCSPTPRTSRIEKELREALRSTLTDIPTTYNAFVEVANGKREAVDIFGFYNTDKIVIEYDSWWWHSGEGSKRSYASCSERDIRKSISLLEADYKVIRVREKTKKETLPLLELEKENFFQIQWDQKESIQALIVKIQTILTQLI